MVSLFRVSIYRFQDLPACKFTAIGVVLPLLLFVYRSVLWYNNLYILLDPILGLTKINSILDYFVLCYLPTSLVLFIISKRCNIFYHKIYKRAPYRARFLYGFGRALIYLCKNLLVGSSVVTQVVFLYLLALYKNSFLINLRLIVLLPCLSFRIFLFNTPPD